MGNVSKYLAGKLLDGVLTHATYTFPTTVYLALFTTPIHFEDDIGTPTEVSTTGTAYVREAVTFTTATNGLSLNSAALTFAAPTASWGTIYASAVCDASTAGSGHILFYDNICPQVIDTSSAAPEFLDGAVKISLGIA